MTELEIDYKNMKVDSKPGDIGKVDSRLETVWPRGR